MVDEAEMVLLAEEDVGGHQGRAGSVRSAWTVGPAQAMGGPPFRKMARQLAITRSRPRSASHPGCTQVGSVERVQSASIASPSPAAKAA